MISRCYLILVVLFLCGFKDYGMFLGLTVDQAARNLSIFLSVFKCFALV